MRARCLLLAAVMAACGPTGPAPRTGDSCAAEVAARDQHIADLLRPTRLRGRPPYLDMSEVAVRAAALGERLGACGAHPALARLGRFAGALAAEADPARSLGLAISDGEYLARHRGEVALPPLLTDATFLDHLREPAGYAAALAMIEARNAGAAPEARWITLFYQSRFLKTPDQTTHGRLLVLVPGAPDLWIQFGVATPEMQPPPRIHSVSVVAAGGADSFFLDYWRVHAGDRIELATRLESGHGGSNCYACHKQAVLPIRPARIYELDAAGALQAVETGADILAELDRRMAGYGPPSFAGTLDPGAFGPPLGPPGRPRSDALLRRCSNGLDRAGRDRVRAAMRCAGCHDGEHLGAINVPQALRASQDLTVLRHPGTGASMPMVREYVTQGWMPPDAPPASSTEREALYECLMLDYWDPDTGTGVLADWLRERSPGPRD